MTRETEQTVLLSDGTTVHLRPIEPSDADAIVAMHSRFSARTRYLRYFSPYPRIPERDLKRFVNVDHRDREALVVAVGDQLVAVGRYERLGADAPLAEVAFVVEDAYQGRGVGSVLLEHLGHRALAAGITRFVAEVLPENGTMVRIFTDAGYEVTRSYADGVVHLEFPLEPTERSRAVQWERERLTEARSVARLLYPESVAVYGASRSGGGVGAAVLGHLQGFTGSIHAIGPGESLAAPADLAIVAVPPSSMDAVIGDAAQAGVHGLLVFTELDPAQRRDLVDKAHSRGMRVIGPGTLGIAAQGFNASLLPRLPKAGRIGVFCHSGQLGLQMLAEAYNRGLGISSFVSAGRRADVSGNDLLQFWAGDPGTDVIAMYLETFGNPRKFARIARTIGRQKPIVILAGNTGMGSTLDDSAMQALRAHSGVIQVQTMPEMFDVLSVLDSQPLPAGDRVGVVGNAFALVSLAAAQVRGAGMQVGRTAAVGPAATPAELAAAVRAVADSDDADMLVVIVAPPLPTGPLTADPEMMQPYADAISAISIDDGAQIHSHRPTFMKPMVVSFLAGNGPAGVPSYRSIEEGVRALAHVAKRAAWLREPPGRPRPQLDVDPRSVAEMLEAFRITPLVCETVSSADLAVAAARKLGMPVALKASEHPHRIDLGAVRLNLADDTMVANAYQDLERQFGSEVIVQAMAPPGVACVIEVIDDPAFGPVVGFGLGGPVTELVGDRAWRAAPLTDRDAAALVRAPKAAPLLAGVDLVALEELLMRVGQAADEVRWLTLNPVLAHETGWTILHAAGELTDSSARPDAGPRQLGSVNRQP